MINHIDALTKSKLKLGSQVDGFTEFDLMVHSIEVRAQQLIDLGTKLDQIHYIFDGWDLPVRMEDNGSILITLNEIAEYMVKDKGFDHFSLSFSDAFIGAILLYGNYHKDQWTLYGITNGYA